MGAEPVDVAWISPGWEGKVVVRERVVSLAAAPSLLVNADPERLLLMFGNGQPGAVYIAATPGGTQNGIRIDTATFKPLTFTAKDHSLLATMEWYGRSPTSEDTLIIEVIRVRR